MENILKLILSGDFLIYLPNFIFIEPWEYNKIVKIKRPLTNERLVSGETGNVKNRHIFFLHI